MESLLLCRQAVRGNLGVAETQLGPFATESRRQAARPYVSYAAGARLSTAIRQACLSTASALARTTGAYYLGSTLRTSGETFNLGNRKIWLTAARGLARI